MDPADLQFVPTLRHQTYDFVDPLKSNLSGKYVVVTGASKGIGQAIAVSYARAGASGIALLARSDLIAVTSEVKAAAKQAGRPEPKVVAVKTDVSDRSSDEAAAKEVSTTFGQLDVLVNNAGYLESPSPIHESDPDVWWTAFEVNVRGVYLVTRSFLPLLLKGGDKTIINVSSMGAITARAGASAYQTSKQAIIRMTDHLSAEYSEQGLVAFSIHPGGVMTELAKAMPQSMHHILVDDAELAGDVVVFLTRDKNTWLNNRFLSVTWDMEEFFAKREEIEEGDLLKLRLRVK